MITWFITFVKEVIAINLGGIVAGAFGCYDGIAYEIYVSGCTRNCKGCHNPEMQDYQFGKPLKISSIIQDINRQENQYHMEYDIISILGGDLLDRPIDEALPLISILKTIFPNKKLWVFTGAEFSEINSIFHHSVDVFKCGRYIEGLATNSFPASWNQQLYYKGFNY